MKQCDALDGLEDGVLNDPRQCPFDVTSLACEAGGANECLTPEQVAAAQATHDDFEIGGKVAHGTPLGAELPGSPVGWNQWFTGGYTPGAALEYHAGADTGAAAAPATPNGTWAFSGGVMRNFIYGDPDWSYVGYDFADFPERAAVVAPTPNADDPGLSEFRNNGGKLVIDSGWMDGSLTALGTINYNESVIDLDPSARDDVRLFVRPEWPIARAAPAQTVRINWARSKPGWTPAWRQTCSTRPILNLAPAP